MESTVVDPSLIQDRELHPQIQGILGQFVTILRDVDGIVLHLDKAAFNWRPAPGEWSVGECLAHLNLVNQGYLANFRKAVEEGRRQRMVGPGPFTYGAPGRFFLRLTEPPVRSRFPAPAGFVPAPDLDKEPVMAEFRQVHADLIEVVKAADGLDLARIKTGIPSRGFLRFPLGLMFLLVAAHDRRHLWQARNVRNDKRFPPVPLFG